jgi:hypothetical protein
MGERTIELLITGILALVAGATGSLIAPWVHWGIEKKKIKVQKKIDLIKKARDFLEVSDLDYRQFSCSSIYSEIRPYLSQKTISTIERNENEFVITIGNGRESGVNTYKYLVLDDLVELEKKWELI